MKKKFIAVSMVLGALALSSTTLTSCVDDNESASVTKIRDAKAQQLSALGKYYEAQAAYQQAEANYRQAMADQTKQETAQDAEQWAYELEKIQKEYEQQIAMYEQQIANYKNQLATNMDTYQGQLFTNYENAVGKVNEINSEITNNLYLITQLKNELASLKATAAKFNYADQLDIAAEKAKIEVYKQMAASNLEDLKSEFATLEAQITEQTQKEEEATRKLADAKEAFKQEVAPIRGYISSTATSDPTLATSLAVDSLKTDGYFYTKYSELNQGTAIDFLVDEIKYAEGAEELGLNSALLHQYSLKASAVTAATNKFAAAVYDAEKALGASTDAANDDPTASVYAQYNAKGETVKTLQTAYNNALKGTDKDAIEQARKALNDAIAEQETFAETTLADAIKDVEEAKDLQVRFENVQKAFTGDTYKAYETAITTALAGENAKAMVAAQQESNSIALTKAQLTASKTAINTLIGKLTNVTGEPADVNALILASEETIAEKEKNIANRAKYENTSISDQDDPAYKMAVDDAVAMLEAENEQLKVELTAAEARVEAAKAALDAEFGSSASTDTPATETPAE